MTTAIIAIGILTFYALFIWAWKRLQDVVNPIENNHPPEREGE